MSGESEFGAAAFQLSLDAIVMMDEDGILTGWNPAAEELLGWSQEEAVGRRAGDLLIPPIYREAHEDGLRRFRATGHGPVLGMVLEHLEARHRDGRQFPIELRISEASRSGDHSIFVAFLRDISDRKRAQRLQEMRHAVTRTISEAREWEPALQELLETMTTSLGMAVAHCWVLDDDANVLRWGGGWNIKDVDLRPLNRSARSMRFRRGTGLPGRVWADASPVGLLDLGDDDALLGGTAPRRHGLRSALSFPLTTEGRVVAVVTLYGRVDSIDGPLLEALGDAGKQIGQFRQRTLIEAALRTTQDEARANLEFRAFHDALTGLPNRSLFDDRLAEAMAVAQRERRGLALLLLDLDGFKAVNDGFGHLNGDAVLKEAGHRLRTALRRADTVARLGGDEFGIIPHGDIDDSGVALLAAKVARALEAPIELEVGPVQIRASIGGAIWPRDGDEARLLVRNADAAMYHAKRNHQGFATYSPGMAMGRGGSAPAHVVAQPPSAARDGSGELEPARPHVDDQATR